MNIQNRIKAITMNISVENKYLLGLYQKGFCIFSTCIPKLGPKFLRITDKRFQLDRNCWFFFPYWKKHFTFIWEGILTDTIIPKQLPSCGQKFSCFKSFEKFQGKSVALSNVCKLQDKASNFIKHAISTFPTFDQVLSEQLQLNLSVSLVISSILVWY